MTTADLDEVLAIERASFRSPWSQRAYQAELDSLYGVYRVLRLAPPESSGPAPWQPQRRWPGWLGGRRPAADRGPLVGYHGFQLVLDEAHIMTIAVHPDYRRRGLGELLLLDVFDEARRHGASRLTLEVRVGNVAAQELYRKYGFTVEGRRLRYYADGEDGLIMWSGRLDTAASVAERDVLRRELMQRLARKEQGHDPDPGH